ncbi:MAG: hypothetical protein GW817_09505 [Flavobacteriales bacterium]|nr:hypothetical protein [Flavobacteriales bacterium]
MTKTAEITFMVYGQNGTGHIQKRVMELSQQDFTACTRGGENLKQWTSTLFPTAKKVQIKSIREIKPEKKEKTDNSLVSSIVAGAIGGAVADAIKNKTSKSKKDEVSEPSRKSSNKTAENSSHSLKGFFVETGKGIIDDFKQNSISKKEKVELYNQKKEKILNIEEPNETIDVIKQIDYLLLCINDESWTGNQEMDYINKYTDLCYEKVKQLVEKLPEEDPKYLNYKKKIKKLKYKRFFKKLFG